MQDDEMKAKARELAEEVLLERITPLIGKDYSNKIATLRARVAAVRCGNGDGLPEVQTAYRALKWAVK